MLRLPRRLRLAAVATLALLVWPGAPLTLAAIDRHLDRPAPAVAPMDIYPLFLDERPLDITITAVWQKLPMTVTHEHVRRNPTLWRWMHLDDWDRLPSGLRAEGLDAMIDRYTRFLEQPHRWAAMEATDWDYVPQPVRAIAFGRMVEYWVDHYGVGRAHGLHRRDVVETLHAIVMAESFFEHRAVNANRRGNRDLGVAQASDFAREHLDRMFERGDIDFTMDDDDYFNPWLGTRFVAAWMAMLLEEVGGDLDNAVRAYHRGSRRALRGFGDDYLETVRRRRASLTAESHSHAWRHLLLRITPSAPQSALHIAP